MGFFGFIGNIFGSVARAISSVVNTVTSIFIPGSDSAETSYSQESAQSAHELSGFRNINSSMVPSPLIFTEDGIRVNLYGLWYSAEGTTQRRILEIGLGELELVNGLEINGGAITAFAGSSATIYLGTPTQGIDSRYDETPNKIGGLRDTAYVALTLASMTTGPAATWEQGHAAWVAAGSPGNKNYRENWIRQWLINQQPQQVPTGLSDDPLVTVNVAKGIKIPVWNGSDWTTLPAAASGNPAAVIRFYLLLDRDMGGCGLSTDEIDDASFGAVYDWAEVMVSDGAGGTEPRARITYKLDSFKPWTDVLDDLKNSFGGYFVTDGRTIKLKVRKAESSVQDYQEGKLAGSMLPDSFGYYTFSKQERPNRLVGIYKDPTEEGNDAWARTPVIDDYSDQQSNPRGVVLQEITYPAISRQSQAIRMLTQTMNDYRVNWYGAKFKTDIDSAPRERGDVIRIKDSILGDGATWYEFGVERVIEYPDHTRELTLKAYNSTIFNDNLEVNPVALDYVKVTNPYTATDEVTALTITEAGGFVNRDGTWFVRVNGTFNAPNQTINLTRYRVLVKEGAGAYEFVKYISKMETFFDLGITAEVGKTYTVKVQTENEKHTLSDGAESNAITIVGKDSPPSQVTGYTVMVDGSNLKHKWNSVSDDDLFGYRISQGAVYETSILVTEDYLAGTEYTEAAIKNGTRTYWIVAVDNSGNKSTPTSFQINVTNADGNIVFDFNVSFPADIEEMNNAAIEYITVAGFPRTIPSIAISTAQQWDDVTDFEGVAWNWPVLSAVADFTTKAFDLGGVGTGNIILDIETVLQGDVDFVIEINTSDTLIAWNGWQVFSPGTYTCRYFKFKFSMTSSDPNTGTLNVYKINPVFDIIDRTEEKTVTITDSGAGLAVAYDTPFTDTPKNSLGTLELFDADAAKYLHPKSFSETKEGFTLKAINVQTGALDTGSIRYKARGYLLSENLDFKENLANIAENLTNAVVEYITQSGKPRTVPSITIDTSQQWDDVTDLENAPWDLPVTAAQASFTTTPFSLGFIGTGKISINLDTIQVGDVTTSIEINRSDDDITYAGWEAFVSGNTYTCKYFKFKFIFTSDVPATSTINYRDLNVAVSNLS